MNVLTHANLSFAVAEHNAKLSNTRVSVFANLDSKEIHIFHAQRLGANQMMTVHMTRNATINQGNVNSFVLITSVPKVQDVRLLITKKFAPATTHWKGMDTPIVQSVRETLLTFSITLRFAS